jgi:hypothetical protein
MLMHCEAPRSTKSIGNNLDCSKVLLDADTAGNVLQIRYKAAQAKCQLEIIIDAISSGHPWYLAGRILADFLPWFLQSI